VFVRPRREARINKPVVILPDDSIGLGPQNPALRKERPRMGHPRVGMVCAEIAKDGPLAFDYANLNRKSCSTEALRGTG
jgi:hypothetical protein